MALDGFPSYLAEEGCVVGGRLCCDSRMRVPPLCREQMNRGSLFRHGRAETGTVNNKGNWTGSEQNMSVLDMVILSHRCGEAECLTDPERSWQAALKGGLRNDPPFQMAL